MNAVPWPQIAANLLSLAVALWLDWPPALILLLFWTENIVVAIWQLPRILLARGGKSRNLPSRLAMGAFFLVHYGLFTLVHGIFIFTLFLHQEMSPEAVLAFLQQKGVLLALTGMMLSHGSGFVGDLLAGRITAQKPEQAMSEPYHRIVILHLVVLGSGLLLDFLPWPVLGVVLLGLIKTIMDIVNARRKTADKEPSYHGT